MEKRYSLFLSLLLTAFIAANFFYFSNDVNAKKEKAVVARVIDGDTLELNDNRTIRLLNINAPEKKDPNSNLAANYLKKFQNKTIQLEPIGTDKYHRLLARLFYDNLYLNFDLTSKGLVSKYLVQKNEKSKFARAEREAIEKGVGIWEHSTYYGCFQSEIDAKKELVTLINTCKSPNANLSLEGWILKDEGRTRHILPNVNSGRIIINSGFGNSTSNTLYLGSSINIWNDDADTLYLFDRKGKIAHTHEYGY